MVTVWMHLVLAEDEKTRKILLFGQSCKEIHEVDDETGGGIQQEMLDEGKESLSGSDVLCSLFNILSQ